MVPKEYKGNSAEILRKYIYIYKKKKLVTTNIYNIFLSLQIETVTVGIRALAGVQEWKNILLYIYIYIIKGLINF